MDADAWSDVTAGIAVKLCWTFLVFVFVMFNPSVQTLCNGAPKPLNRPSLPATAGYAYRQSPSNRPQVAGRVVELPCHAWCLKGCQQMRIFKNRHSGPRQ